jgi:hypothetical protein
MSQVDNVIDSCDILNTKNAFVELQLQSDEYEEQSKSSRNGDIAL